MGPIFSVTSMRPSGRKARRQGNSKVVTVVMVKGRLASGFCSPTLTWAHTAADARVTNNAVFTTFIVMFSFSSLPPLESPPLRDSASADPSDLDGRPGAGRDDRDAIEIIREYAVCLRRREDRAVPVGLCFYRNAKRCAAAGLDLDEPFLRPVAVPRHAYALGPGSEV